MDKKDLDEIWDFLKSKNTNLEEVVNVRDLIEECEIYGEYDELDLEFDENEVIKYVTGNKRYELKYTRKPDFDTIVEECIENGLTIPHTED